MSLGITAGSRDGFSLVERLQDRSRPNRRRGWVRCISSHPAAIRAGPVNAVAAPQGPDRLAIRPTTTPQRIADLSAPLASRKSQIRLRLTLPDTAGSSPICARPLPGFARILFIYDPHGYELARLTPKVMSGPCGHHAPTAFVIVTPTVAPIWDAGIAPIGQWQVQLIDGPGSECDAVIQRDDRASGISPGGKAISSIPAIGSRDQAMARP